MKKAEKYTLVRHSAWSRGNVDFKQAVEMTSIPNSKLSAVALAGGLIFNSYDEASKREFAENYPEGAVGIIPQVKGTFSTVRFDELEVYVPAAANG